MTIRHLKIFIAVAETGKMSLASERLFLTQPTVSQAIRELEEHYQLRLFERLSKRLYITDEGRRLLRYARQAVEQFDRVEQKMAARDEVEYLRLGATLTVGDALLAQLLNELGRRNPELDVYTFVGNTSLVEEKLLNTELAVGVVEGNVKSPDLKCIPLVEDFLVLACSANHPFAGRRELYPDDLEGQRFAMREPGSGTRALFEWYLGQKSVKVKTVMESNTMNSIVHAVTQSNCLAVVSVRLLEEEIRKGNVHIFCTERGEWDRSFKLVYHKDHYLTAGMELLKECLRDFKKPALPEDYQAGIIHG